MGVPAFWGNSSVSLGETLRLLCDKEETLECPISAGEELPAGHCEGQGPCGRVPVAVRGDRGDGVSIKTQLTVTRRPEGLMATKKRAVPQVADLGQTVTISQNALSVTRAWEISPVSMWTARPSAYRCLGQGPGWRVDNETPRSEGPEMASRAVLDLSQVCPERPLCQVHAGK